MDKERERLVTDNQGLVIFCLRKYNIFRDSLEYEELVSEGTIGLVKAAINYDPTRGYKFNTYAYYCIRNEIIEYLKKNNKNFKTISTNAKTSDESDRTLEDLLIAPGSNYELQLMMKEEVINIVNRILNCLDRTSKIAMLLKIAHKSIYVIAKYIGCSAAHVSRIQQKAINKIRYCDNPHGFGNVRFDMTEDIYQFTFKQKDIKTFKKVFESFAKEITSTENVPSFRWDYNDQYAVLQIIAIPESFYFVTMIINQLYKFIFE